MTMAQVREVGGVLVLDDPAALAMMTAVAKVNCLRTAEANAGRIAHFARRIVDRGADPASIVIVCINVDDPHGSMLADALMPGMDWQAIRDRGERPFANGLAVREGIQEALDMIDADAAANLREWQGVAVVVVDHGTADVFTPGGVARGDGSAR